MYIFIYTYIYIYIGRERSYASIAHFELAYTSIGIPRKPLLFLIIPGNSIILLPYIGSPCPYIIKPWPYIIKFWLYITRTWHILQALCLI